MATDVVIGFYTREANAVHDVMDELGVPRISPAGDKLSMSQRAKLLHDQMVQFNTVLAAKRREDEPKWQWD